MTPQSRCLLVLTASPVPSHHPLEAITEPGFFPAMTPTEDFGMLRAILGIQTLAPTHL